MFVQYYVVNYRLIRIMSSKKKYLAQYKSEYSFEFPFISSSKLGSTFAFCSECGCDINIAHSGKGDIVTHVKSKKHQNHVKQKENNLKLDHIFSRSEEDLSVIRAECYFTAFLIEHNLPFSTADHAGPLFRKMFPGVKEVKKYGSGRTKTTSIMRLMAKEQHSSVISKLQNQIFAVATDGSNDTDKMYPIVVTFYNNDTCRVENALLCAPSLEGDSTGKNIGNLIINNLVSRDIPLKNCIAFGCDNANVMIGKKNGVAAILSEAHPNIIIMGCLCHLIDIAAGRGLSSLPIKIDENLVDIFYYFKKSNKRADKLKVYQEFHETEINKVLKHVETRWLSVGRCLNRTIEQWNPLLSFFEEEVKEANSSKRNVNEANLESFKIPKLQKKDAEKKSSKQQSSKLDNMLKQSTKSKKVKEKETIGERSCELKKDERKIQANKKIVAKLGTSQKERIYSFLFADLSRALCLFIQNITPVLEKSCIQLQAEKPMIPLLKDFISDIFKELLSKFIKADVVKQSASPFNVQYHNRNNQKDDDEIVIGTTTTEVVKALSDEEKIVFFNSVRKYFTCVLDYIYHSFPYKSEILENAAVLNPNKISDSQFSKLKFFLDRFPAILPIDQLNNSKETIVDILQSQFCELQMEELPQHIMQEERIDVQWHLIRNLKNSLGVRKYDALAKVMLSLLVIPHSNANCERVFSQVRKIKTDFRSSMSSENLENLLMIKCSKNSKCFEENFTPEFLKKAKSATYMSI